MFVNPRFILEVTCAMYQETKSRVSSIYATYDEFTAFTKAHKHSLGVYAQEGDENVDTQGFEDPVLQFVASSHLFRRRITFLASMFLFGVVFGRCFFGKRKRTSQQSLGTKEKHD